jgi:threonine dehydratase
MQAHIFMPLSTPRMKQNAVLKHGAQRVEVHLVGDTYDQASHLAHAYANKHQLPYIHAYDDLAVMAGQGTLADEIVLAGQGPYQYAFLQVGGGGMAAACASWLKLHYPDIHIIGVEGQDQASMAHAIDCGQPAALDTVDIFCDGTAVRKAGQQTHAICSEMIDEWITVSNDEVSAAIQFLWEHKRCIPEPSGAMGVAAALQQKSRLEGQKVLTIICGANIDFEQLASIARRSAVGATRRRFLQIEIPEKPGAMLALAKQLPASTNIVAFQYGKTQRQTAAPILGFEVCPESHTKLLATLKKSGLRVTDVSQDSSVRFNFIPFQAQLFQRPQFIELEFHERCGALTDLLQALGPKTNLCYFNYNYSGERVGRALMGFEFADAASHSAFKDELEQAAHAYRSYQQLSPTLFANIITDDTGNA